MNYKMLWIKLNHLISIRAWDINNMMMLFCKFAVVTELKMRLTQAFFSSSHSAGWDDEFKKNSVPLPFNFEEKLIKIIN